jgi:endonuclease-3
MAKVKSKKETAAKRSKAASKSKKAKAKKPATAASKRKTAKISSTARGMKDTKSAAGGRKTKAATKTTGKAHSTAEDKRRILSMIEILKAEYPDARCQLDFTSAFELLTATILAAQCTDVMVNQVTKTLFKKYPTPKHYVDASSEELEQAIFKTGFYRNKTKSLKKCCQSLIDDHGGEVPRTMAELTKLGGVGRKTANCVLGNVFGIPGIVVDTHVRRLAMRMGYTEETNPDKIEMDLGEIAPKQEWTRLSHLLADHGRHACSARKPRCEECPVEHLCPKHLD